MLQECNYRVDQASSKCSLRLPIIRKMYQRFTGFIVKLCPVLIHRSRPNVVCTHPTTSIFGALSYHFAMILIVFTTTLSTDAETLAESLIEARLAACVQIIPKIKSLYIWEGKVQKEEESLLLIKTLPENYDELELFITENHSYEVPEIVSVESSQVSGPYMAWMRQLLTEGK